MTDNPPPRARLHETRTADNSAAFLLPKLKAMVHSNPKLRLLDVGCGSGTITTSLAQLIPEGHVTGIDVNPHIIARAQALAEQGGVTNISFQEGSVFQLPFKADSFDVVFCHQVLLHIGSPWDALRAMLHATKPGGIVAAREGDYDTECIWPAHPEIEKFHKLMAGLMRSGGGSSTAGRQLRSWAMRAGATSDNVLPSFSTTSYISRHQVETWCESKPTCGGNADWHSQSTFRRTSSRILA
jgi:ubiquinone/menaquinone biosynthesis C-methylase UbiE